MKFFKKKRKLDPYSESIIRTFCKLDKVVTPTEVAEYLRIHPNTARVRILKLRKQGFIVCKKEGKKLFCRKGKKMATICKTK